MNIERLSLDQLRAMLLVVDTGSFSAAAKKLNRVQSSVTYTIQQLEAQLGVELFNRAGYRPKLTPAGQSIVEDARVILSHADSLIAKAGALTRGLESSVSLAIDVLVPFERLAVILGEFRREYPTVSLLLNVGSLGAVVHDVDTRNADIGLTCSLLEVPERLIKQAISVVTLVAVAAPTHPLATRGGRISEKLLKEYTQIVLSDRSDLTQGKDYSVFSAYTFRVSDLSAKLALIRAGLGFGNMPLHMVAQDLEQGLLQRIDIAAQPRNGIQLPIFSVHRPDLVAGEATGWLLARLAAFG